MSAPDPKAGGGNPAAAGGKAAGKGPVHSGRLAGMAFMQRAAQRKQLQQRKEQAVRCVSLALSSRRRAVVLNASTNNLIVTNLTRLFA
jgi:hypothetical protein